MLQKDLKTIKNKHYFNMKYQALLSEALYAMPPRFTSERFGFKARMLGVPNEMFMSGEVSICDFLKKSNVRRSSKRVWFKPIKLGGSNIK